MAWTTRLRRNPLPLLPYDYLERRYIRAFQRLLGPVQPAYLWLGIIFGFFFVVGAVLVIPAVPLNPGMVLLAGVTGISMTPMLQADPTFAAIPQDVSGEELGAIYRRIRRLRVMMLAGLLVGGAGAYIASGTDGLAVAGTAVSLVIAVEFVWLFATSTLHICNTCGGVALFRRYRGRWLCVRCGAPLSMA